MTTRNYCTVHEAALALSPSQLSLLLVGGDTVGVHWPPLLCTSAMDQCNGPFRYATPKNSEVLPVLQCKDSILF